MKVLVVVENYPNLKGNPILMYVHTRNLYYKNSNIDVEVLSFSAHEKYVIDGIQVLTINDYINCNVNYDCLIVHAANVRHHYRFLKKYGDRFSRFIFFFHGHEVLRINKVYSAPYPYIHVNRMKMLFQDIYDTYKLYIWRKYFPKVVNKSTFVFVSNWMLDEFEKWTQIPRESLEGNYCITYNCVADCFEKNSYNADAEKEFDFITVRANLDGSKYAVDIVNELALKTPKGRFLVVGKGDFFNHYEKAPNVEWWDMTLNHEEIMNALDRCRFALMPTRTDAQGLMMCEMAAYGIPVITSDIDVCHEVFAGFNNVYFISNDNEKNLESFLSKQSVCVKQTKYYEKNTADKEVNIIIGKKDNS